MKMHLVGILTILLIIDIEILGHSSQERLKTDIQAQITSPQELFIKEGSTFSLTCIIELQDLPPSNVTWFRDGAVIDFDDLRDGVSLETKKGKRGTTSKLLITRVQPDDSANYTCASSKVTPASVIVYVLHIVIRARIMGPQILYLEEGSTINLTCIIDWQGLPPSNVTWFRDRAVIDFDDLRDGVSLETEKGERSTTSKLLITRVQPDNSGIYTCASSKVTPAIVILNVIRAEILGPQELYLEEGSTISLICYIYWEDLPPSNMTWFRDGAVIDFDDLRDGVSLETKKGERSTTSKLLITRVQPDDSANYTCASSKVTPASVILNVNSATMQNGDTGDVNRRLVLLVLIFLVDTMFW